MTHPSRQSIDAVVGFMFSLDRKRVALIRKNRPPFQAGKLNGVGGKLDNNHEWPINAMVREFAEETGMVTLPKDWQCFARIETPGWRLWFFRAFGDIEALRSMTDERVEVTEVSQLRFVNTLGNVQWLVPLALDDSPYELPIVAREV